MCSIDNADRRICPLFFRSDRRHFDAESVAGRDQRREERNLENAKSEECKGSPNMATGDQFPPFG